MKNQNVFPKVQNSRRRFLKNTSGAIFYITTAAGLPTLTSCKGEESNEDIAKYKGQAVNVWVQIHENNKITIFNPAAEMGQGSMTALPLIIAEELDVDWANVHIEHSPVEPEVYGSRGWGKKTMITVASRSVATYYDSLRQAGGQARYVLLSNVAEHWNVPLAELSTEPNFVIHQKSNRRISYGEITSFLKSINEVPEIPASQLKNSNDFRLIGKVDTRYDVPSKVDGSAKYAIDIQIPGMVYGVISRSPVNGSSPQLKNEQAIQGMEGIIDIIKLEHGIGIIAKSIERALKAKNKLEIEWSKGVTAESHTSEEAYADYEKVAARKADNANIITNEGSIEKALKEGSKTYLSEYKNDHICHVQMEPLNAIVSIAADNSSAQVWLGTQDPTRARLTVAEVLGMDISQVILHRQYLGGGFGRRSQPDFVSEAAQLAKVTKRPVKLIWTREDDIQYGMFRPMSLQRMQASVDQSGHINGWQHIIVGTGGQLPATGAKTPYYTFPNQHIELRNIDHGIRTWWLRGVGYGPNKWAIESFIDEIALDQNIDPFDIRIQLMKNQPRAQNVLRTVAEMADWKSGVQERRAKGIAFAECSDSLAACVCEISLDCDEGSIKVHNVWVSLDAGVVVQPNNVIAQMEGAIIMGMSNVIKEHITFKDGKVQQTNYHDYPILRMDEIPESIEVKIVPSQEQPTGIGELGVPIIGGAIANSFALLTGKRLKHMPFTPAKVLELLEG